MEVLTSVLRPTDMILIMVCVLGMLTWMFPSFVVVLSKKKSSLGLKTAGEEDKNELKDDNRSIIKAMADANKTCIVFFGSQTGNAESYASRLAKEANSRFSLPTMVADMEDFDYDDLKDFPEDHVAIFVLATYGEGEPTDNAVEFYNYLSDEVVQTSTDSLGISLSNFHYTAFGLGNTSYEHYNAVVRTVDVSLQKLGAVQLCPFGEGDDGNGTVEEDFIAWKETMWNSLSQKLNLKESQTGYEAAFSVILTKDLTVTSPSVYLGQPPVEYSNEESGAHNSEHLHFAPVTKSWELFNMPDRNCIHMELDISASGLSYRTGDHVAVWPMNANVEVDRFLRTIGLAAKSDEVVRIEALDATTKVPFPSPTTYAAIARYYLDIGGSVSRQTLMQLASFASNAEARSTTSRIAGDKDLFAKVVTKDRLNIAQVLELAESDSAWNQIPFSFFIENLPKLQPRYYSISSSSLQQPDTLSITAVVEDHERQSQTERWKGVATNYLLATMRLMSGHQATDYQIEGSRGSNDGYRIPIHIRTSTFKLPADPTKPIIMVGPGTGIAPFRGFIQERAAQVKTGMKAGSMILFYGCRTRKDDFMYHEDWTNFRNTLGDQFKMITAFSREGSKKVYVQDRLLEYASEINQLLQQSGSFYVCGDAVNMARAVSTILGRILAKQRNLTEEEGHNIVKQMRASRLYQEDTW